MSAPRSSMVGREMRERESREMAEDIIKKPEIVLEFYDIMKSAAKSAVKTITYIASTHNMGYDLVSIGDKGTRVSLESGKSRQPNYSTNYTLEYHSEDIYVYGGSALTLYDVALRGLKEKSNLNALEKRVLKSTTDIDLVWFPRVPKSKKIATSQSLPIEALADECKIYLERIVANRQKAFEGLIREQLQDRRTIKSVNNFTVNHTHIKIAGVHSIKLSCDVNGITLQLCEMSIHDSGSSQLFDENHKVITYLRPMTEDPIYCPPSELVHLDIHDKIILVPNLALYCKQQLFTFGNMLKQHNYQKALSSFYRVAFILYLLHSLNQNQQNGNERMQFKKQRNIKERIDVENVGYTINEIHIMINHVKRIFHKEIQSICSTRKNDEAHMLLCGPLLQIRDPLSYSMPSHSVSNNESRHVYDQILELLKSRVHHLILYIYPLLGSITPANSPKVAMDLLELQREAFKIESEVEKELITPPKNNSNLDQKIEEFDREINRLDAKYHELVTILQRNSLRRLSMSSAQLAALPPRHRSMSQHRSMLKSQNKNNTRKKPNNN